MLKNYSLGIDVGIGSVGIAVINDESGRIEYLNSRIFESSENKKKNSLCQDRRSSRGVRRNIRRRHHRKERLKWLFEKYGITTQEKLNAWYRNGNSIYEKINALGLSKKFLTRDIYPLRAIALDYKLSGEELAAILLHICNHRGYRPFYEEDIDDSEKKLMKGRSKVDEIMKRDGYRTVGEMYALAPEFRNYNNNHINYTYVKNSGGKKPREEFYLVERAQTENEVRLILEKQKEYHSVLTKEIEVTSQGEKAKTIISDRIFEIMFTQRDFEDGPSTEDGIQGQKYHGFGKDSGGYCTIYKNEKRGIRASLIGDLYALTNLMSQYTYINKDTGEVGIDRELAKELVLTFAENGEMSNSVFNRILKKYNFFSHDNNAETTFAKCNKFTKDVKKICDTYGVSWKNLVGENPVSCETKIHKLATVLAYNVTPRRREKELKKLDFITKEMSGAFGKNFGGTTMVSDKFMIESIEAFMNGEIYGDFQARKNKELEKRAENTEKPVKIPKIKDIDIIKNPVVFRSINETRKMVNAIIEKYGSPSSINVEVASELNQSQEARAKEAKRQRERENLNDEIRTKIAELRGQPVNSVSKTEIDRFKLYEEQEGKCLYSGEPLTLEKLFTSEYETSEYEIDHIIPFSLILDDTLNNKCLVLRKENQKKGQRTPLQYFKECNLEERLDEYKSRISALSKKVSKTKIEYLKTPDIFQDELFDCWKSRNINDTRYIAKYVVSMLNGIKINNGGGVTAVKGGLTSRFRRWWLVNARSGLDCYKYIEENIIKIDKITKSMHNCDEEAAEKLEQDKKRLIDECATEAEKEYGFNRDYTKRLIETHMLEKDRSNNLHHGVDAAIIACLSNKYIQLALDNYKLFQIWRDNGKPDKKYYLFVNNYSNRKGIIKDFDEYLQMSIEKLEKYFHMSGDVARKYLLRADKIPCKVDNLKDQILVRTYDYDEKTFKYLCEQVYDKEYFKTLQLPLVSRKPQRSLRKSIMAPNFKKSKDPQNPDNNPDKKPDVYYEKNIGIDFAGKQNKSYAEFENYFCAEIFKNNKNKMRMRGIRQTDLVNINGKLYLKCQNPEGYKEHVMYLFKNDYISVKSGDDVTEGYYQSICDVSGSRICIIPNNLTAEEKKRLTIKMGCIVTKYNVDILGRKGGVIKCGGHSLSILPKE